MTPEQIRSISRKLPERDASMNPDPEVNDRIVRNVIEAINESGHHVVQEVDDGDDCDVQNFQNVLRERFGAFRAAGK